MREGGREGGAQSESLRKMCVFISVSLFILKFLCVCVITLFTPCKLACY